MNAGGATTVVKRLILALLCLTFILSFYGCASILDDDTMTVTAHSAPVITATDRIIEASNYTELKEEIIGFIDKHEDMSLIQIYTYDGDIREDINLVCTEIVNEVPLGAYAVSKITSNVTQIVSTYQIEIHILYNDVTKEQVDSIIPVSTFRYLKADIQNKLADYAPSMTIFTKVIKLTVEDALSYVSQTYYENPRDIVMLPITTVAFYPEVGMEQIIEFTFGYRYEISTLEAMETSLRKTVQNIAESITGSSDGAILLQLGNKLMEITEYDKATASSGEYSTQNIAATAYGALITGSAVGEGYAMAYKALCDELGIECYVVMGTHDGVLHAWNIAAIDGKYYHIDISMCDLNGISTAFLINDTDMKKTYSWDTSKYEVCDGPITYASLTDNG